MKVTQLGKVCFSRSFEQNTHYFVNQRNDLFKL